METASDLVTILQAIDSVSIYASLILLVIVIIFRGPALISSWRNFSSKGKEVKKPKMEDLDKLKDELHEIRDLLVSNKSEIDKLIDCSKDSDKDIDSLEQKIDFIKDKVIFIAVVIDQISKK